MKIKYVDSSELGLCPASVDMVTGTVSINTSVWRKYDSFERSFILAHEEGHYKLQTDSEYEADAYALRKVYRTAPRSLKRALMTLCKIRVIDNKRLDRLYKVALELDAEDGSQKAAEELERINQSITQNFEKMTTKNKETYLTKSGKTANIRMIRRADGSRSGHGMNGIHVGDWYLSITNLLLMAIVLLMITKK